jgi:hypothetical protein
MNSYLLSIYQPSGDPPQPDVLEKIMSDVQVVADEGRAAGAWKFSGGLEAPSNATVLNPRTESPSPRTEGPPATDGPYVEGKEHLGGVTIVEAGSLDEALEWGRKLARATTLPVEVRQFQHGPSD